MMTCLFSETASSVHVQKNTASIFLTIIMVVVFYFMHPLIIISISSPAFKIGLP